MPCDCRTAVRAILYPWLIFFLRGRRSERFVLCEKQMCKTNYNLPLAYCQYRVQAEKFFPCPSLIFFAFRGLARTDSPINSLSNFYISVSFGTCSSSYGGLEQRALFWFLRNDSTKAVERVLISVIF